MWLGKVVGRAYRWAGRQQAALRSWLVHAGCSPRLAEATTIVLSISVLALVAYVVSWLVVPLVIVGAIAARFSRQSEQTEWRFTERDDHRQNTFYDPNAFADDSNPRWDDDR